MPKTAPLFLSFFFNISKDEQRYRLFRRLRKEEKNWKFSPGDLEERKLWNQYLDCYEDAINRTSKTHAPWYVIPSDDKDNARYIVASIMYDRLKEYDDIKVPELDPEIKANIEQYKKQLEGEE